MEEFPSSITSQIPLQEQEQKGCKSSKKLDNKFTQHGSDWQGRPKLGDGDQRSGNVVKEVLGDV
jgi:hypothetical protein